MQGAGMLAEVSLDVPLPLEPIGMLMQSQSGEATRMLARFLEDFAHRKR